MTSLIQFIVTLCSFYDFLKMKTLTRAAKIADFLELNS